MEKGSKFGLSCCSISSIPLDYEENKKKVIESIRRCKELNCQVRVGGELELCGVSCKDSFKEVEDIHEICWHCLSELLKEKCADDGPLMGSILCFVSMPVYFKKQLYSCQVVIYRNQIILLSPKECLSDEERKYFSPWSALKEGGSAEGMSPPTGHLKPLQFDSSNVKVIGNTLQTYVLPKCVQEVTNQKETYIGRALIQLGDILIGHLFLDELIHVERGVLVDDRVEHFNLHGSAHLMGGSSDTSGFFSGDSATGEVPPFFGQVPSFFERDAVKLSLRDGLTSFGDTAVLLNQVDVLLVSGHVTNELQLFKKYFIQMMHLTKQYPHMVLSYNANSGCDSYFYKYDGFSFISKNNQVLTKNARFTFDEVQVASVGVPLMRDPPPERGGKTSLSIVEVEKLQRSVEGETHADGGHDADCILSSHKELELTVKYSKDAIWKNLPQNFNWQMYTGNNPVMSSLMRKYHPSAEDWQYQFGSQTWALHNVYEELCFNCALFLWHILHLTNAKGFMLALSGGVDSGFSACMVYLLSIMVELGMKERGQGAEGGHVQHNQHKRHDRLTHFNNEQFRLKLERLLIDAPCRKAICNKLLNTLCLPSKNSSENTKSYAEQLSSAINSYHTVYCIDGLFAFFKSAGRDFLKEEMKFKSQGGSTYEDLCLQNVQSRSRLLMAYFFSPLICQQRYAPLNLHNEFLLTIATGNLDETLTGYYTKYDCSSGDINLIGNVSKILIKETMCLLANDPSYDLSVCNSINQFHPSAELKPLENNQTDEDELNLKYLEIKLLAILKNHFFLGPSSMVHYLSRYFWPEALMSRASLVDKVRTFFSRAVRNTHKVLVLPPSLAGEACGLHLSSLVNFARVKKLPGEEATW
ncbi:glutamine-dependent NAD(+) synthetase, putative [Plasmodium vivax]|uniref:NAD synthase, putative n=4 Tax=Plasmodium vivax TaxID=5855 RepID=A5K6Y4_PLAVS|nr:NAD synthase, putative [Plasmodium vivax]KMZ93771.1 NAD synthase [Plasmodium vivax Mauritania I]KNA00470.1 NAD synthase [Plasmodium vivax North Korean]EDL45075.1 NAD synthase, putative [Plasmodium vivax]CAI7719709.1 glutamine-dependent NAD(+) synthetase, putative [Plasmodium vivax]SCO72024.1 glutamine-dependent NAD(+) synthetase, putative [Plasmodium vivax]|eukprot:XP_001614802.1 NAD synthase [Plasmodium vivax Sal-1]